MLIFGTDEAGYGPNLGPLVVSACAWEVPDSLSVELMYKSLFPVVLPWSERKNLTDDGKTGGERANRGGNNPGRFLLDDSKKLYQGHLSAQGVKNLEYALLTCLVCLNRIDLQSASIQSVVKALARTESRLKVVSTADGEALPGLDFTVRAPRSETGVADKPPVWEIPSNEIPVPVDARKDQLTACVASFQAIQESSGVHLKDLRSDVVQPLRFNELCLQHGNKSTVLSRVTLNALHETMLPLPCERGVILCDKHGSRDRYADLLKDQFETDVEILQESRAVSRYRFAWRSGTYEIAFQAKGDSQPPAALASVADKYLRELFMRQFNDFWQKQIPGLEPTAGYPVDAKRFLEQIDPLRQQLGIPLEILWRER